MTNNDNKRSSQRTLILILIVATLPVVAAYVVYFTGLGMPENTVNSGTLLKHPIHLRELVANASEQKFIDENKWRLVIPITDECDQNCRDILYTTRQVHIRLSEKSSRVSRVGIILNEARQENLESFLTTEHPYLKTIQVNPLTWYQWLDSAQSGLSNLSKDFYLLVDQEGHAMMMYTQKQTGNQLLKDLKRAIKFSIDYQK